MLLSSPSDNFQTGKDYQESHTNPENPVFFGVFYFQDLPAGLVRRRINQGLNHYSVFKKNMVYWLKAANRRQ